MPGKHKVENDYISLIMDRFLIEKLNKKAADLGVTRNAYCVEVLKEKVDDIVLPEETVKRVEAEIAKARAERQASWTSIKTNGQKTLKGKRS